MSSNEIKGRVVERIGKKLSPIIRRHSTMPSPTKMMLLRWLNFKAIPRLHTIYSSEWLEFFFYKYFGLPSEITQIIYNMEMGRRIACCSLAIGLSIEATVDHTYEIGTYAYEKNRRLTYMETEHRWRRKGPTDLPSRHGSDTYKWVRPTVDYIQ
jgi:hypothetical protein